MDKFPENFQIYERVVSFVNSRYPAEIVSLSEIVSIVPEVYHKDRSRIKAIVKMLIRLGHLDDLSCKYMTIYNGQPPRRRYDDKNKVDFCIVNIIPYSSLARLREAHNEYVKQFNKK